MAKYTKKFNKLALKYYGTSNVEELEPYQIDKLITWVTGTNPDQGKNTPGRTAGRYLKGKL